MRSSIYSQYALMDWEGKFSSIIKETETNLARVKQRLGSARSFTKSALMLNSSAPDTISDGAPFCGNLSYPINSSMYMPTAGAPWPGLSASLLSPYTKSNSYPNMAAAMSTSAPLAMGDQSSAAGKQGFNTSTTYPAADCYTGCDNTSLSMLHDKINMQNKVTENLTNTVRRLEEERNFYYRTVRDLRDELTHLNRHITEGRGDARTDQNAEHWKREMTREIHGLQQQLHSQRGHDAGDSSASSQVAALARDLHELKMHLHDECDSMKRTIDGVKSRIGKVEVDVSALRSGNTDLNLKQCRMEEESYHDDISRQEGLTKMTNGHKSLAAEVTKFGKDRAESKGDITDLKSSLRTVRAKLGNVEARMYAGLGTSRKGHTVTDFDDLLSPDTSDLELDLSSSDAGGLSSHFTMTGDDFKLKPDTFLESADLDLSTDFTSDALDIKDLV